MSLQADKRLYPSRPTSPPLLGDRVRSSGNRGSGVSGLERLELLPTTNIFADRSGALEGWHRSPPLERIRARVDRFRRLLQIVGQESEISGGSGYRSPRGSTC